MTVTSTGLTRAMQGLRAGPRGPPPARSPARQLALDGAAADGRAYATRWSPRRPRAVDGWLAARERAACSASATRCSAGSARSAPGAGEPSTSRQVRSELSGCLVDRSRAPPAAGPRPRLRRGRAGARRLGVAARPRRLRVPAPASGSRRTARGAGVADRNRLESGRGETHRGFESRPLCQSRPQPCCRLGAGARSSPLEHGDLHQDVALLDDVAGRDLDRAHGAGRLGEHRDLHLHRLQQHHGVADRDRVTGARPPRSSRWPPSRRRSRSPAHGPWAEPSRYRAVPPIRSLRLQARAGARASSGLAGSGQRGGLLGPRARPRRRPTAR